MTNTSKRLDGRVMAMYTGQPSILLCPDVLLEILMHLQPGRYSPEEEAQTRRTRHECRKALLACSLACHILSDLALGVLWRALDDILPLLRLLDTDEQLRPSPKIVLKSRITPERWSRLQGYATHVREVGPPSESHPVHGSVWTFLGIKCRGSPLLPHLYVLEAGEVSQDLSSLFLLLSPSLRSLSLRLKADQPQVGLLALQHITQIAPRIDSLNISGHPYLASEHTSTLQNFSGLTELSVSSCFSLPFSARPALFQLALSSSHAHNAPPVSVRDIDQTKLQSPNNSFRSLRKLTIRGSMFNDLVEFFLSYYLPVLEALVIQVNDIGHFELEEFRSRLAMICQQLGRLPASLTSIGCEFYCGIPGQPQDTLVRYLEPLLAFPLVERCHFTFHHTPPSICDGDLIRFGDAWANLQSLEVRHIDEIDDYTLLRFGRPESPTVLGLTELACRCPNLIHVHFPELDASALPEAHTVAGLQIGHSIREISFDHVRYAPPSTERPCAVGAVLDTAFPKLDVSNSIPLSASAPTAGRHTSKRRPAGANSSIPDSDWSRVMMFVHAMQLGRRHLALNMNAGATNGADLAMFMAGSASLDLDIYLDSGNTKFDPFGLRVDAADSGSGSEADDSDSYSRHDFFED